MGMLDNLFGPHLNNLQSALDRTSQRQTLLMTNLANVNVPGYKRKDLDFHTALQGDLNSTSQNFQDLRQQQQQASSDRTSIRNDGNNVDLEREVMSISETDIRFQALTDITTNYFSNLKSVIREGK